MRTTINLDDDVHDFLGDYARARGITLSAAITELIRKAESAPEPKPDIRRNRNGFPLFPPAHSGTALTAETVKKLEEEVFDPKTFA